MKEKMFVHLKYFEVYRDYYLFRVFILFIRMI